MTDTDPEGVLTPDELTLDDDRLQELAEDRFVISVDEAAAEQPAADAPEAPEPPDADDHPTAAEPAAVADTADGDTDTSSPDANATAQLPDPATLDGAFAVAVAADLDGAHIRVTEASNDVAATFEALVTRYAEAVAPDVPTDEAVAVLLNNADLDVEVTPR
jgi:hypothetical protein